jgi:hypothetical protein
MITGNKGEWSEAYVLLRLLAQGRIYAADENLEQIDDMYFPILKILREESKDKKCEYSIKPFEKRVDVFINGKLLHSFPREQFSFEADFLYKSSFEPAFGAIYRFVPLIFKGAVDV